MIMNKWNKQTIQSTYLSAICVTWLLLFLLLYSVTMTIICSIYLVALQLAGSGGVVAASDAHARYF